MAILFLFTITCSVTTIVLAALTVNAGSSFSVSYEKVVLNTLPPGNEVHDFLEEQGCIGISSKNCIVFDYFTAPGNVYAPDGENLIAGLQMTELGSLIYVYTGVDESGVKNIYVLSYEDIFAPEDCSYMFSQPAVDWLNGAGWTEFHFNNFHTENVKNMSHMFYNTRIKTYPYPNTFSQTFVVNFDTSSVTDMSYMFYYHDDEFAGRTNLDISTFDTHNVTDMSYMFYTYEMEDTGSVFHGEPYGPPFVFLGENWTMENVQNSENYDTNVILVPWLE